MDRDRTKMDGKCALCLNVCEQYPEKIMHTTKSRMLSDGSRFSLFLLVVCSLIVMRHGQFFVCELEIFFKLTENLLKTRTECTSVNCTLRNLFLPLCACKFSIFYRI